MGLEPNAGCEVKNPQLRTGKELLMGSYFGEAVYLLSSGFPFYRILELFV